MGGTVNNISAFRRCVMRAASFHCTPGTLDACQVDHDDDDFLMLCRTCGQLSDRILAVAESAFKNGWNAGLSQQTEDGDSKDVDDAWIKFLGSDGND